jgi:hypothetical protein
MLFKIMNVILQSLMKNSYTVYLQEENVTVLISYFKKQDIYIGYYPKP